MLERLECLSARNAGNPPDMIMIGVVLLILGIVTGIGILSTVGLILLLVGAVLLIAGSVGRPVGRRRYYY